MASWWKVERTKDPMASPDSWKSFNCVNDTHHSDLFAFERGRADPAKRRGRSGSAVGGLWQMASAANEKQGSDEPSEKQTTNETETTVVAENEAKKPARKTELAILKFVLKYLKLVGGALLIWFMGWLGLSYVWIICGLFIYVLWRLNADERKTRRDAFREAAEKEQEVVEARMEDLPSWVFFPDVERAEWLNKETVEPEIQKNVPSFLSSIHFGEISLGQVPPRIGGIKTYSHNVDRNEIILDIDLIYAGDSDFELSVKGVTVGIEDLQVRGSMRVILRPLIPAAPLVGGVSVFFLNRPDIDFDLTNLANILDIPGLSDILRGVIDDVVASIVVLPNKITGVLRIEVLEAKDLIKKDIGVFKKGSSDPYVVLRGEDKDSIRDSTKKEELANAGEPFASEQCLKNSEQEEEKN
ncbi:Extended synaptotagmin-3 [Acropora cervicornis]|uniref:Extended synaptotagmin-3 n=1 Tax=Acropora cervicornis TaxID=6130 RepID=A0AAD9QZL5_ACRCE|nr:Extended synaptotagmin-3 [Acropora cervicornis]